LLTKPIAQIENQPIQVQINALKSLKYLGEEEQGKRFLASHCVNILVSKIDKQLKDPEKIGSPESLQLLIETLDCTQHALKVPIGIDIAIDQNIVPILTKLLKYCAKELCKLPFDDLSRLTALCLSYAW